MDKMITTETFTMARWQIVVKKSEATKHTKDQNKSKIKHKQKQQQHHQNNNNKTGGGGRGLKKQISDRMV